MAPKPNAKLVPVGQVFQIFPGKGADKYPFDYIGINVTDHPFATQHNLTFRPPGTDGSDDVVVKSQYY